MSELLAEHAQPQTLTLYIYIARMQAYLNMANILVGELAEVEMLLNAQVGAGLDRLNVLESLSRSWLDRLMQHPKLSTADKKIVTDAIRQGPWTEEQRKDLASAVLGNGASKKKNTHRVKNQRCLKFENFITAETVLKLKDPSKFSVTTRLSFLANTARILGITNPDEETLFRMVACLTVYDCAMQLSQDDVWQYMNTLQLFIKNSPKVHVEYLEVYPPTAELLPDDIRKNAYPDGNVPPEVNISEIETVLSACKKRGGRRSSTSSSSAAAKRPKHHSACEEPAAAAPGNPLPGAEIFRLRSDSTIVSSDGPSTISKDRVRHLCKQCGEDPDLSQPAADEEQPPQEEPKPVTIDDFEREMLSAHEVRKKPASKKRPAASSYATLRRPAAAAPANGMGCLKCRGNGCSTCANPNFSGKRLTHVQWLRLGYK